MLVVHVFLEEARSIIFPVSINRILGLPPYFQFLDSYTEIYTQPLYAELKPVLPEEPAHNESRLGLVTTNVVEPQIFGEKNLPVLRTFVRKGKGYNTIKFDPVIYLPLSTTDLQHIKIELLDSSLSHLPNTNYPSVVTLHIKPKFL